MLQNEGEVCVCGGGGEHEIFFFLKGGNRKFSDVCWGEQKIFMNLNPIPGASLVVKNDTSLMTSIRGAAEPKSLVTFPRI